MWRWTAGKGAAGRDVGSNRGRTASITPIVSMAAVDLLFLIERQTNTHHDVNHQVFRKKVDHMSHYHHHTNDKRSEPKTPDSTRIVSSDLDTKLAPSSSPESQHELAIKFYAPSPKDLIKSFFFLFEKMPNILESTPQEPLDYSRHVARTRVELMDLSIPPAAIYRSDNPAGRRKHQTPPAPGRRRQDAKTGCVDLKENKL